MTEPTYAEAALARLLDPENTPFYDAVNTLGFSLAPEDVRSMLAAGDYTGSKYSNDLDEIVFIRQQLQAWVSSLEAGITYLNSVATALERQQEAEATNQSTARALLALLHPLETP